MLKPEQWKEANEMALTLVGDTEGMDNYQRVWTFLACLLHSLGRITPVPMKALTAYTCAQMVLDKGVKKDG